MTDIWKLLFRLLLPCGIAFVVIDADRGCNFNCPQKILQYQVDSVKKELSVNKKHEVLARDNHRYYNGVIVKISKTIQDLEKEMAVLEDQIRMAIAKGEKTDSLIAQLLEKKSEYMDGMNKLSIEEKQNERVLTNRSIDDSLQDILNKERINGSKLDSILMELSNKCND
jgi:hypothetical protein